MNIKSEEEWAERAAAFLKHKLQECEVTYAELAKRLKKHGFKTETEASVTNKLAAGYIPGHVVFGRPCGLRIGRRGIGGNLVFLMKPVVVVSSNFEKHARFAVVYDELTKLDWV